MRKRISGIKVEGDQESTGSSSEEMESPRHVAKAPVYQWGNCKADDVGVGVYLNSQILRIRAEDSLIGEDTGDVLRQFASVIVLSKPILPASPLGGRTAVKTTD